MRRIKAVLCVLLALCMIIPFAACKKEEEPPSTTVTTTEPTTEAAPKNINILTGEANLKDEAIGRRPVGIMVENHPDARPQWGLNTPDIVVEGLVEGGITRMLWLYSDVSEVEKIGPCRSARNNYVEVAEAFDAIYAHFGGSSHAYRLMNNDSSIDHIDYKNGDAKYDRDHSRGVATEHTAYTTGEWLMQGIENKGVRTEIKEEYTSPFTFAKSKKTLSGGECKEVKASFSYSYNHTFKYDETDGLYYNYMNSNRMMDADGTQMAVSNVLIISCNVSYYDSKYAEWNLSSGSGYYISNGTYEEIKWEKGSTHDMFRFTDKDGKEIEFNIGKFWIGFVPSGNTTIS
ncbi:MAG: DUF3048 domain-containing protein [Clostridia bacterium]|nr:DUF3048 domain-containing protein [Clostridia bacterium]